MAVLNYKSTEATADYRGRPTNDHGKVRFQYFDVPTGQVDVEGDAASTIDLCTLPPGAVRVLPNLSKFTHSAFGTARTLDFGHRAYMAGNPNSTEIAEDLNAFADGHDVSSAGTGVLLSTANKFDVYSVAGIVVTAQVNDASLPVNATLSGYIAYLYE